MAIKGSLKEASLPDVIQLLFLGRRTGCLALADRHNFGTIYFEEGHIVYAAIVNRRDRLGDILLRSGTDHAGAAGARRSTRQEGDREHKLGEILVELGVARAARSCESHMRLQIEEAVYYLFTWTSGTFNFEAGVRPEQEDFLVRINPEFLLLEGARRVDEWSLIEKKIPSFDLIFSVDPAHIGESAPELSAEQRRLVPLLDGTRDVQAVIDDSGLVEFEVGKALFGLDHRRLRAPRRDLGRGGAEGERRPGGRAPQPRHRLLQGRACWTRRCASSAGWPSSGPADASAPFYLGLIALRQARWEDAAAAFKQAAGGAGRTPGRAAQPRATRWSGSGRLDEAEAAYGDAAGRARDDARDHARLERGRAQAGRAPGGAGPARARPGAAGRQAGAGALVLGGDPRRRGARRQRRRAPGGAGRASARTRPIRCCRTTSPCCSS